MNIKPTHILPPTRITATFPCICSKLAIGGKGKRGDNNECITRLPANPAALD